MFATWIGHGWARALLILATLGGDLLSVYVAVNLAEHSSHSRLVPLGVAIVSYSVVGMTLLSHETCRRTSSSRSYRPGRRAETNVE